MNFRSWSPLIIFLKHIEVLGRVFAIDYNSKQIFQKYFLSFRGSFDVPVKLAPNVSINNENNPNYWRLVRSFSDQVKSKVKMLEYYSIFQMKALI